MRLLVSVIGPSEVGPAAAGGADIIDIKDLTGGPLARPPVHVIRAVRAALPPAHLMSVALGDATDFSDTLIAAVREAAASRVDFIKIGLVVGHRQAEGLLRRLVGVAGQTNPKTRVVAMAYADDRRTGALNPFLLPDLAANAGAYGVMLDTAFKDGRSLLAHLQERSLSRFVTLGREAGLSVGLAGSLGEAEIERLRELEPDVVGVRGAVCRGGRGGSVDAARVRHLSHVVRRQPVLSGITLSHSSPGGRASRK